MMKKSHPIVAIAFLASTHFSVNASTEATNASIQFLLAKANGTCIGQSRMIAPNATAPLIFPDKVAILLQGVVEKGKPEVNMLCLYDRKSNKAVIEEYYWE